MGMITYGKLNLAKIRDEVGLDFAHYTYEKDMCSCCYYPHDLSSRYWKGKTREEREQNREKGKKSRDYEYILFKNAENGGGTVTSEDYVCVLNEEWCWWNCVPNRVHKVCIEWKMTDDKLDRVCGLLQEQLGSDYKVIKPLDKDGKPDNSYCVEIEYIGEIPEEFRS